MGSAVIFALHLKKMEQFFKQKGNRKRGERKKIKKIFLVE